MEKQKIDKINEYSRLSKIRALTPQEEAERKILREEYISEWRASLTTALDNTFIVDENGVKRKLKKKY